ncbi:MAG: hypothetical protein R2750_11960 [Bacteroidales bacterium]
MKTTKVILVAALMAFATISFSQSKVILKTDKPAPELSVTITVRAAMQIPGLERAMRIQLNSGFLLVNDQRLYTAIVKYNHAVYYITGTYKDWRYFFSIKEYPGPKEG